MKHQFPGEDLEYDYVTVTVSRDLEAIANPNYEEIFEVSKRLREDPVEHSSYADVRVATHALRKIRRTDIWTVAHQVGNPRAE